MRITTRYDDADFTRALMGVLHETGHALYEQGRPAAWLAQPVGDARGMVMHESQSLLVEMQACRTREFMTCLAPIVQNAFGTNDAALSADNLHRLYTRVAPGFIRVDADEVTYPAHILLRYDLERAMIDGFLAVDDLPGAFNEGCATCWGSTFPTTRAAVCRTSIGRAAAGAISRPTRSARSPRRSSSRRPARRRRPCPALARGDFAPLLGWLRADVHGRGSLLDTDDLLAAATGRPLGIEAYLAHLRRRYLGQP